MQYIGRVNVLESAQNLVEEVTHMVIAQLLRLQQLVHVRLHQTLDNVAGHWSRTHSGHMQIFSSLPLRLSRPKPF